MTEIQKEYKSVPKVPNLRFPGFTEEWETKKLGEIADFKVTNSFSRENLNYELGTVKNIHYGDIHTKFQTLFDITSEIVPFINDEISVGRISDENYCKEGDVIFADASEDLNDVGKSIEVVNVNGEKLLSGLHTLLARPNANVFHLGFNGYLFKSNSVRTQIQKESQGSKVLSINIGRISKIDLSFPDVKEQERITALLSLLDERIHTQNKIIENLKTQMLGLQEKIFRQKIKFKDSKRKDFPLWISKNGGELFESVSNKNHNSDLPILAITQDKGAIPRDLIDYQITVTERSIESYKVVEIGDFIISLRSFQGGIEHSDYKGICSPAYIILRNKIEIAQNFYKYYLKNPDYIKLLNRKLEGIRDGKMISFGYFAEIELPFPIIEEQKRIASFLTKFDLKIQTEKDILEQLNKQKQHLLQQMFV